MNISLNDLKSLKIIGDSTLTGFHTNVENIGYYDNISVQFFANSPYSRYTFALKNSDKLKENIKNKKIFIHSKYIINISKNVNNIIIPIDFNIKSSKSFGPYILYLELKLLDKLEIKNSGTVLHLTKGYNKTKEESLIYTANMLSMISSKLLEVGITKNNYIILETSNNTSYLGSKIEDYEIIWNHLTNIGKDRIRFCIDTNHIHITGYYISNIDSIIDYFYRFDRLIGIDKIVLFHLNDSEYDIFSSNVSHAGIGHKVFPDFNFLYNSSKEEILNQIKFVTDSNLNIIKSISNKLKIPIIIENKVVYPGSDNENYVLSQLKIYNNLKIYDFNKIINKIKYKIILQEFKKLRDIYTLLGNKKHFFYQKIITILNDEFYSNFNWYNYDTKIINEDIKKDKNFNEKTIDKIIDIIRKNKLDIIDTYINSNFYKTMKELQQIPMIGYVTAKKLYDHQIYSIKDLKKNTDLLNKTQKDMLNYYDKINRNITRKEAEKIQSFFEKIIENLKEKNEISKDLEFYFLGSYIRDENILSDIDILIISNDKNDKNKIIDYIHNPKYIISDGDVKTFMILFNCQIDLMIKPFDSKFESILYFTGPKDFNIWIRKIAKFKNFKLTENDLTYRNNKIKIKSEKDIFDILNLKYITPKERNRFSIK